MSTSNAVLPPCVPACYLPKAVRQYLRQPTYKPAKLLVNQSIVQRSLAGIRAVDNLISAKEIAVTREHPWLSLFDHRKDDHPSP